MRTSFKFALAAGVALAFSGTAFAASIVAIPNATADLNEKIHNNNSGAGNAITLKTMPSGYFVDYSSTGLQLDAGNGMGFAQVTGSSGPGSGFDNLTLNLQNVNNPTLGASAIHFKIDGLDVGNGRNSYSASKWDLIVYFVGGGSQSLSNNLFVPNDKFLVTAGMNEVISGLKFFNARATNDANVTVDTDFRSLKQVSFASVLPMTGAVPEPASWAMMLAGFGVAGSAARRRRRKFVLA